MQYYDSIAEGYENLYREEQLAKLSMIKPFVDQKITVDSRLLDIGCGTGISLEPWDCQKIGIDPSEKLLAKAKSKGLKVKKASAELLPFPDKSFDIVIALTSIHHTNFSFALKEVSRICKGFFVFSLLKKSKLSSQNLDLLVEKQFHILTKSQNKKDVFYFCQCITG